MKIAFISTLSHAHWGGSEELWQKTALYALNEGHQVHVMVYKWDYDHPKIIQLKLKNASVGYIKRIKPGDNLFEKIKIYLNRKINRRIAEFKALKKFKPDIICISQGGTFDVAYNDNSDLRYYIKLMQCPYFLICQNNADVGYVPEIQYKNGYSII